MKFACDCPDWAGMCKHVAAVLYGVGARLDHSPEMLFLLRGVNHEELVDVSAVVTGAAKSGSSRRKIATSGLADVFGIDMAVAGEALPETTANPSVTKSKTVVKQQTSLKVPEKPCSIPRLLKKKTPVKSKGRKKTADVQSFPEPLSGDAIYTWRSSLGETQAVFAARLRITAASISQWEKKGSSSNRNAASYAVSGKKSLEEYPPVRERMI